MKRFGPSPPCLLLRLFLCPRVSPIFLAPPVGLGVPSYLSTALDSITHPRQSYHQPRDRDRWHSPTSEGIYSLSFSLPLSVSIYANPVLRLVTEPSVPRFSLHYLFAIISNSGSTTFSLSRSHACTLREISLLVQRADVACFESVRSNAPTMSQLSCLRNFLDFILRIMAILRCDDVQAKLRDIFAARRHADRVTFKVSIIKV